NFRHGGVPVLPPGGADEDTVPLDAVPFALLEASDAEIFPAPRPAFLRAWMSTPGHRARALMRDGVLAAWGVIRPSRDGRRIGPLVAHDTPSARTLLRDLIGTEDTGPVFLDVPATNAEALALATSFGLSPAFETARMYTGPIRPLRLDRLYGISTLELG
ncbi:MAG: GNAT family N-acetyltransferase, partial [Rhizobiales bacterium]|nr:GNAT family N-acetyltransferase [Hyphomicrobiales bacterium]